MAENLWSSNPVMKMWSEMSAPLCGAFKQSAVQYIDNSEKWAHKALELSEKTTAWAKDTPLAPMFEMQQSLSRQIIESSTVLARRLWQIEEELGEKAAKRPKQSDN